MRNVNSCGIERFKEALDSFVSKVPDEPKTDGLTPGATDLISGRRRPTPWSTSSVQGGERPRTPPTSSLAKAPSYRNVTGLVQSGYSALSVDGALRLHPHMTHSQMLGKVESGGGPIFKVVLEC